MGTYQTRGVKSDEDERIKESSIQLSTADIQKYCEGYCDAMENTRGQRMACFDCCANDGNKVPIECLLANERLWTAERNCLNACNSEDLIINKWTVCVLTCDKNDHKDVTACRTCVKRDGYKNKSIGRKCASACSNKDLC